MPKRKTRQLAIRILIICSVCCSLIIASFIYSMVNGKSLIASSLLVRSETTYIILVLALLLLSGIITMIFEIRKRSNANKDMPKDICKLAFDLLDDLWKESDKTDEELKNTLENGLASSNVKTDKSEEGSKKSPRFCMLSATDERMEHTARISYDEKVSLNEIAENFRSYCASKLKLHYDIEDIRRFIAGLSVSHVMVMQGMSGTGKTSLAYAFGEYMQNSSVIVPIQPMWKERSDLIGYFNEFTGRFNETTLLQKMYEANYNDEIYITVLDEMNIARVEYYFAEFLSLLELPDPEKRYLDVVSDKWDNDPKRLKNGQIKLPDNMWFIGTVNNDDSTFAISDKVYDRAMVMNLDKKCDAIESEAREPIKVSASRFKQLGREAAARYAVSDRNMRRIKVIDGYLTEKFRITFGNRIMKQINSYIPVYIACGGKELDAIDDILSKKVLRKLEAQNPVYVKSMAEELCGKLDEVFGVDTMPQCKSYMRRLEHNV